MGKYLKYFSFQGRANRQRYWLNVLALIGILIACAVIVGILAAILRFLAILALPAYIAALAVSLAVSTRRLHDRNKSAWWLLLFVGLPTVLLIPGQIAEASGSAGGQLVAGLFGLISLPFSIWGFVEIGCLKGTTGPNKYGDDPLGPRVEEVFA